MAGSNFTSRDFNSDLGNVLNNPIANAVLAQEVRARSGWMNYESDIPVAGSGLITANVDTASSAAVKRVSIPETAGTDEVRFAYMKQTTGKATYGQQAPALADDNQFLNDNIKIGEIRSPAFRVMDDAQARKAWNTLKLAGGARAIAEANVRKWSPSQYAADHISALCRGASDVYISSEIGALNENIGGVNNGDSAASTTNTYAGSQALHENVVMFNGSSTGTTVNLKLTLDTAAGRQAHEDTLADTLLSLQTASSATDIAKNCLTRDSFKGLAYMAGLWNINKIQGKNYDYIFHADWAVIEGLIGSLSGTDNAANTLVQIWANMIKGGTMNDKATDYHAQNLILDGILLVPDRMMAGWRPSATGATPDGSKVVYGGASSAQSSYWADNKHTSYQTNTNTVGVGFLLGDTALISANDKSLELMVEEGAWKTGVAVASREYRTVKRACWKGRDSATTGQLINTGSIQVMSRIPGTLGVL